MRILIVESKQELGRVWLRHLQRQGAEVTLVGSEDCAIAELMNAAFDVIILDLMLEEGSSLAVSCFAGYRRPETKVVFVSNSSFFSDGSIFEYTSNACAYLQREAPPEDLVAIVHHYGCVAERDVPSQRSEADAKALLMSASGGTPSA